MLDDLVVKRFGDVLLFYPLRAVNHLRLLAYVSFVLHLQFDLFSSGTGPGREWRRNGIRFFFTACVVTLSEAKGLLFCHALCQLNDLVITYLWSPLEFAGREHLPQGSYTNLLRVCLYCAR